MRAVTAAMAVRAGSSSVAAAPADAVGRAPVPTPRAVRAAMVVTRRRCSAGPVVPAVPVAKA